MKVLPVTIVSLNFSVINKYKYKNNRNIRELLLFTYKFNCMKDRKKKIVKL